MLGDVETRKSKFVDLCVDITIKIKSYGFTNFTFNLNSENLNYNLNTNLNSENGEIKIKNKKRKSPSSRRRNFRRLRNWLSMKQDLNLDTTIQSGQSATKNVKAELQGVHDFITCTICDTDFSTERSLSSHIRLKHRNRISQLDGLACSDDDDDNNIQTISAEKQDEDDDDASYKFGYHCVYDDDGRVINCFD